jgi:hypothetical protein
MMKIKILLISLMFLALFSYSCNIIIYIYNIELFGNITKITFPLFLMLLPIVSLYFRERVDLKSKKARKFLIYIALLILPLFFIFTNTYMEESMKLFFTILAVLSLVGIFIVYIKFIFK